MSNKQIASQASKGGKALLKKRGRDWFSKIGKKARKKQLSGKH